MGVRTFSWTGYTASPSLAPLPSMVSQTTAPPSRNSLSLPERYHPIQRSSLRTNSPTGTPDQSLPRKNSFFSLPKNPSIAALSAHLPFLDIERVRPCSPQIDFHPGHR